MPTLANKKGLRDGAKHCDPSQRPRMPLLITITTITTMMVKPTRMTMTTIIATITTRAMRMTTIFTRAISTMRKLPIARFPTGKATGNPYIPYLLDGTLDPRLRA